MIFIKNTSALFSLTICLLLFSLNKASSQTYDAPGLICVNNDTLVWNTPTVTCGNFINFQIWGANTIDGNYTNIATITNETETNYYNMNNANLTWYYFMTSTYDCAGMGSSSSDTLSNLPISPPTLLYVTVNNNKVDLVWEKSTSPQVISYIIYRNTSLGTTAIDTVSTLNYTDLGSAPNNYSETYHVVALDPCGNASIFESPQNTIYIPNPEVNYCERSAQLKWNAYSNWLNDVKQYEIWESIDGSDFIKIDSTSNQVLSYTKQNLNNNLSYSYYIKAIQNEPNNEVSFSNVITFIPTVLDAQLDFSVNNISYTPDNQITVSTSTNENIFIHHYNISANTNLWFNADIDSLNHEFSYTTQNGQVDLSTPLRIEAQATNDCSTITKYGSPIYLHGEVRADNKNALSWTKYNTAGSTIQNYKVYRSDEVAPISGTLSNIDSIFLHPIEINNINDAHICYYVIGLGNTILLDGTSQALYTRSNTVCLEQDTKISTPNAFAPLGENNEFKPILIPASVASYSLQIYDRWGGLVFESSNINSGWNGTLPSGRIAPQGMYSYLIKLTSNTGKNKIAQGTFILIL
ncbi:MAG: gliding motility-associated C-terminal domain-containing protein [Saprospiraceae bacterium]|nr:gliding motility-associated C-terminal domain-containing protein [Saprospiraceae bacterium]